MKVVTCYASKGGVGKTTAAVNIAAILANRGHETILIDLDPNGSCALHLGTRPATNAYRWFADAYSDALLLPEHVLVPIAAGLQLLPSNSSLRGISQLFDAPNAVAQLIAAIRRLALDSTEYLIIDAAVGGGVLRDAAVRAAHVILHPFQPSTTDLALIPGMFKALEPDQNLVLLPSRYKPGSKLHRAVVDKATSTWPTSFLANSTGPVAIRESATVVEEAVAAGKPLIVTRPSHQACVAYKHIVDELEAK